MNTDKCNMKHSDVTCNNVMTASDVTGTLKMTGNITDKIYDLDGNLIKTIEDHNIVVDTCMNLFMALLKHEPGYTGVQYWAVGTGKEEWDKLDSPPNPNVEESQLISEIGRMPIELDKIRFLDTNGNTSTTPTNIIEIKRLFDRNDCNGHWREFGIFGGNATTAKNSGIMINKKHHGRVDKTTEMIIERTMRFTLTLS